MPRSIEETRMRSQALRAGWAESKKYIHTDATDAVIQSAYYRWTHFNNKNALAGAAKQLNWPVWVIRRRGKDLGLAKTKEKPWTAAEEQIVEQWAFMCHQRIAMKLKAAGFHRTQTAIHVKMKRLKAKRSVDGWTARALSENFGVDDHKVVNWFKRGMLKGTKTGVACGQNEKLFFSPSDVRHFILHHPEEVDLAKCEKYFVLGVLCPKELCADWLKEAA